MDLTFEELMGDASGKMARALAAGQHFLRETPQAKLLPRVGQTIGELPATNWPDKRWFQKSYGRKITDAPEELMAANGMFYLTEQRQLLLDCTGGHYQMTWGYEHPELTALLRDGIEQGIVWDNHSNVPSAPVKRLAGKLIELLNPDADMDALAGDGERLNTVLTGCATGSVACAAAMKIQLLHYARNKSGEGDPVFITLDGNYHGTDLFAQRLRGMWPEYFTGVEIATVQPNDPEELASVFAQYRERVAGFWAEPIMMNREAIVVEPEYLRLARQLCDQTGALMVLDEIQTGFWFPEIVYSLRLDLEPDFIVLGKGMTAGLHPLSALVYRGKYDLLEQYDAISTNGNAALAAYVALGCIALIEREADTIATVGEGYQQSLTEVVERFPETLVAARGMRHMSALKFRDRSDALGFHAAAVERGLWLRAHAYHEGHSTVLTKFALPMDEEIADFTVGVIGELLAERSWA